MRFPARCLSAVALVAALAACSGGSSPDRAATKTGAEPTGATTTESRPAGGGEGTCPLTLPNRSVPADVDEWTAEDSYGNGKLWTQLWPYNVVIASSGFVRKDGTIGMKWPWWRGARGELTIEGRRLDGEAEPLAAEIPEGYGPSGFQPSGILFPSEGCWEVTGTVGDASLTFVTLVVKASTYSLRGPWAAGARERPNPPLCSTRTDRNRGAPPRGSVGDRRKELVTVEHKRGLSAGATRSAWAVSLYSAAAMAVPKRKTSKSRRDKRRANHKASIPALVECPQCHQPKRPHHVCPTCGTYRGREVEPLRTTAP